MTDHSFSERMPQFPESYWMTSSKLKSFSSLTKDLDTDIAIVGGGITGITAAYLLAKEGLKVTLIDAGTLLNGTTGHTTAKITAQHGLIYDKLINSLGQERAQLYYQANSEALQFIRSIVDEHKVDCDFTEEAAYVYTESGDYFTELANEIKAYEKLGIKGAYVEKVPLSFPVKAAVIMNGQAQFHPLKYLSHLVDHIVEMGGEIYENTTAIDIDKDFPAKVVTRNGQKITCKHVLICSHFPFFDKTGLYFARMYAERSYVLAVKTDKEFSGGMFINAEKPTRSLRYTSVNGERLVLFGGEGHKTGQSFNTHQCYDTLLAFAEETYGVKQVPYRWSAQDLFTLDDIPYIGAITSNNPHIMIATGYAKWGMTNGTNAAMMLRDAVIKLENPYHDLFTPSRLNANVSVKNFLVENADVAKHLVKGKFERPNKSPEDLDKDEGSVVMVNGKRAGAYRDKDGQLFIVDTTCTHLGCELEWNNGERTWDCPCHGSRFAVDGEVIEGPTKKPLERIQENL